MEGSRSVTALYRKYRPQDFDEVVGQEAVVRTLRNAIERDQLRQAYLFAGPRGTGKTSMARILAKALNCASGPTTTPDGTCQACVSISAGTSLEVVELADRGPPAAALLRLPHYRARQGAPHRALPLPDVRLPASPFRRADHAPAAGLRRGEHGGSKRSAGVDRAKLARLVSRCRLDARP